MKTVANWVKFCQFTCQLLWDAVKSLPLIKLRISGGPYVRGITDWR